MKIEKKQDLLMKTLESFYSNDSHIKLLYSIVNKEHILSLRVIDYLCTNYSKNHNVLYNLESKGTTTSFNLHIKYRSQLKAYSKIQFDPFRRHNRVDINCSYSKDNVLETTVAQLNFFKWAIENKVLDWLNSNLLLVESEMTNNNKKVRTIS